MYASKIGDVVFTGYHLTLVVTVIKLGTVYSKMKNICPLAIPRVVCGVGGNAENFPATPFLDSRQCSL